MDVDVTTLLTNAADVLTVRERRAFISASDALLDAGLMSGGNLLKTLLTTYFYFPFFLTVRQQVLHLKYFSY